MIGKEFQAFGARILFVTAHAGGNIPPTVAIAAAIVAGGLDSVVIGHAQLELAELKVQVGPVVSVRPCLDPPEVDLLVSFSTISYPGISTSGVVLSTLREAVDKDYNLTVLSDLCADRDEEVHRVLIEKVFPRHADVRSGVDWIIAIS